MKERLYVSIVDIGSNSVRMNIVSFDESGQDLKIESKHRNMLGLVSYIKNGELTADGIGKLYTIIREYLSIANSIPVDYFMAFATESLRLVSNSNYVIDKIKRELGVEIEILDSEEEAYCDNIAVKERFKEKLSYPFYVIDMGGGSTEINLNYDDLERYYSLKIGSLKISKDFINDSYALSTIECDNISNYVFGTLNDANIVFEEEKIKKAYLVGGTGRAICRVCLGEKGEKYNKLNGKKVTNIELDHLVEKFKTDSDYVKYVISKYCPDRVLSFLGGTYALNEIVKYLGIKRLVICNDGVREGFLATRIDDIVKKSSV